MDRLFHTRGRSDEQRQRRRRSGQDASRSSSDLQRCVFLTNPYMCVSQVKIFTELILPSVWLLPLSSEEDLANVVSPN
jgi:hypothetical protein